MPDPKNAKSIFLAAIEIESEADRRGFVNKQCEGNEALAAEVNELLDNQPRDSYLESPVRPELLATQDAMPPGLPLREIVDTQVGPYKIRERIGEGGMGAVYVAEQEKPLRRKVALKLIKPGMDSKAVLGRFEAERNALALMNHPHIAKVLDAGTTGDGHPFFVMELVNGIPITEYCDEQKLSVRDRLQLFVDVCSAIQHAHQKGIIHRDIKPSNVLVTELDGKPIAKVIDFGVAKALNQSLTEHSVYTAFQTVIGTPLYMSPEQASFSAVDVDTRSDVYSLGVLLYELLTGTTPFTQDDLKQAAQDEIFKLIREQEPPRPSNRISSLGQTATRISQLRRSQPQQLTRSVQGDLDWIVMKALSKERSRRYDSANRLAEDVDRHLKSEVVEARPPSFTYQLSRLYKRHQSLFVSLSLLLVFLTVCLCGVTTLYYKQMHADIGRKKAIRQYEDTLGELSDQLFGDTMELILSGESKTARQTLSRLESLPLKTTARKIQLCKALLKVFGNDAERNQANEELIQLDSESSDLVSRSLLLSSYIAVGNEWDYFHRIHELQEFSPKTFEDYLFRGYAYAWALPDKAIADLQFAVEKRRSSGIARAILADALQRQSQDRPDTASAIHHAQSAVRQAEVAAEILPRENKLSIISRLDAYTGIVELNARLNFELDQSEVLRWEEKLSNILHESLQLGSEYDWRVHRAQLDALKVADRRKIEIDNASRMRIVALPEHVSPPADVIIILLQLHYEARELQACRQLIMKFESTVSGINEISFLPGIELDLQNGRSIEQIQGKVEDRVRKRKGVYISLGAIGDWQLLCLVGNRKFAQQRAASLLDFLVRQQDALPAAKQVIPIAKRMAGSEELSDSEILSEITLDEARVNATYWLGIDHLARNEREKAQECFKQTMECGRFRMWAYKWAWIFYARLEDPNWLPWIKE